MNTRDGVSWGDQQERSGHLTRRSLLTAASAGALGILCWAPVFRIPASLAATMASPPNFPAGISLYQQAHQNWSGQIAIENVWTCAPRSPDDGVTVANWAYQNGCRIRAKSMSQAGRPSSSFENLEIGAVTSGLITTVTWDIWGFSKNVLLYVKPTILKIVQAGYVVLTARASIQQVVSDFYAQYTAQLAAFQAQGQYPMNDPLRFVSPALT